eukprot:CAMPEP_0196731008 /NCGR_PEP_ID=MMETSP1091-20130531/10902_1 /TAXON_ID=302021 /ORGANISM="Rhodomonas sp., Strain CCMP768" /LENGTH=41 /DNA_ID= /DNA_START= /DNA_END= /DNA_ORIENTATION=
MHRRSLTLKQAVAVTIEDLHHAAVLRHDLLSGGPPEDQLPD